MNEQIVTLTAFFKSKEGKEKQLREVLSSLIEPTRKENGCIFYFLHQYKDDPKSFIFYEQWENQETLSTHQKTEHLKSCMERALPLLEEKPTVKFLNQI